MTSLSNLSRRQAMTGLSAIGAAVAVPVSLAATPVDRLAWDRTINRLGVAEREMHSASQAWDVALTRFNALKPTMEKGLNRPLPWEFLDEREVEFAYDTAAARKHIAYCKEPDRSRYTARLDGIDRYREQVKRAKEACKLDTYSNAVDTAGDRFGNAEKAMFQTPAPDLEALHFKLDRMFGVKAREEDGDSDFAPGWHVSVLEPVMADVRRLLKGGPA